jgi:hypothetical protein
MEVCLRDEEHVILPTIIVQRPPTNVAIDAPEIPLIGMSIFYGVPIESVIEFVMHFNEQLSIAITKESESKQWSETPLVGGVSDDVIVTMTPWRAVKGSLIDADAPIPAMITLMPVAMAIFLASPHFDIAANHVDRGV